MKKALLATLSMALIVTSAYGQENLIKTITIVNHFGTPLKFNVDRNPKVVPNLARQFELGQGDQVTSRVAEFPEGKDSAYIQTTRKCSEDNAFWGVEPNQIHGYIDKGIAYSWNNTDSATIIFCTPAEYAKKGRC